MTEQLRTRVTQLAPWVLLIVAAVLVSGGDSYLLTVGTVTVIWAILALGLNAIMGYSGLINLGLGAFYALGAYGAAILDTEHGMSPWIALLAAPIVALVLGLAIGPVVLRTKGLHFAVATLGIGIIVSDVLLNWISVTNGPIGISGVSRPGPISVVGIEIDPTTTKGFYVLCVLLMLFIAVLAVVYHRSRLARVLVAVHDDELLARSLGFPVTRHKVLAFALSGAVAAFAGVIYAWFIRYISPEPFTFFAASFPAFVLVAVGGPGTVWGPIVGAIFLTGLPEFLDLEPNTQLIVYGAVLLAIIAVLPSGLVPSVRDLWRRGRTRFGTTPNAPKAAIESPEPELTATNEGALR